MKNQFNKAFIEAVAAEAKNLNREFKPAEFIASATRELEALEMKDRIKKIGEAFYDAFNRDFTKVVSYGKALFMNEDAPDKTDWKTGIKYEPLAHAIQHYGHSDFQNSMFLMAEITKRYTSEFAVRSFMLNNLHETIEVLTKWSTSDNHHLRRLASEGSRTRLPWGEKLTNLISEPHLTRTILENLKTDPSKYVQKSVANHLNDISKDHLDYFYSIISEWAKLSNPNTDWIVKHALRNEIKKGNATALQIVGVGKIELSKISFEVKPSQIRLGQEITLKTDFSFEAFGSKKLVIDYGIHLCKAGGKSFFKVFKWKTAEFAPNKTHTLIKKHRIQDLSTRKFHPGNHNIDLLINGEKVSSSNFLLEI